MYRRVPGLPSGSSLELAVVIGLVLGQLSDNRELVEADKKRDWYATYSSQTSFYEREGWRPMYVFR